MRSVVSGFLKLIAAVLALLLTVLAIQATVILIHHGYTHIWLAWFVGYVPAYFLPFFTNLRWLYLGTWLLTAIIFAAAEALEGN